MVNAMGVPKLVYVDIGELGWSLNLSAHLNWMKKNTNSRLIVITFPDRKCLYKKTANLILNVPSDFYEQFKGKQSCLGLFPPAKEELREYFKKMIPFNCVLSKDFSFDCRSQFFISKKLIYKPYEYSKKLNGRKKILIFPRHRNYPPFNKRDLSRVFYIELIEALCYRFSDYEIKTVGLNSGSYNINEIKKSNYTNGVKNESDIQAVIDECQLTIAAIGSQSALPKITLLQRVPTFMIGHDKERHTERENWMKTRVGFHAIHHNTYAKTKQVDCINEIINFIGDGQKRISKDNLGPIGL